MQKAPRHTLPRLPERFEVVGELGAGQRCSVFVALSEGRRFVVKSYHERARRKVRRHSGMDIARFEFERNTAFRAVPFLRPYVARPHAVIEGREGRPDLFVQEFVEGMKLEDYLRAHGRLPDGVLEAGHAIVEHAGGAGLFDIDINAGNVILREVGERLVPTLFDFNLIPQYMRPPNPLVALSYRFGVRRKNHRDLRSLRDWEAIAAAHRVRSVR